MTFAETYITECKASLHDNPHRIRSTGLALAITEAELRRARLCDVKNRLAQAITEIERVLTVPSARLAGHERAAERYGDLQSWTAAGDFRHAMLNLHQERERFDAEKQEHRDRLRAWAEEGRAA